MCNIKKEWEYQRGMIKKYIYNKYEPWELSLVYALKKNKNKKYFDGIFFLFLNCFKYVKLGRKKHVVKEFDAYKEGGDKMKNYSQSIHKRKK